MENKLTHEESLSIISGMIRQSKNNVQESSFYLLLWGWIASLAFLGHYALIVWTSYPHPYLIWLISIPGGIISGVYGYKFESRQKVTTHLDYLYAMTWLAFLPPLLMVIFFGFRSYPENITGFILMLAGSAVFISSRMLKHFPTLLGSLILWSMAILALFFNNEWQYLFGAAGTFFGYLIPGYLLKEKERNA